MAETYLVTGGAGNLACQMTFELMGEGDRIVLFDIADKPQAPVADGCEYVRGDLTSSKDLRSVLKSSQPTVVLHLASLLSGSTEQDRAKGWSVNLDGTFGLLECALEMGIGKVFFPSSVAAYGGTLPDPLPEDFPQWPEGLYGVTKVACERLGYYYHHRHGLDFRCLRLPIVISRFAPPGASSAYASHAFVEAVRSGQYTFKVNPGTRGPMVYVRDAIRAMIALTNAPAQALTRRVYNIHGISPSAEEIANALRSRIDDVRITFDPDPLVAKLIESWAAVIDDDSAQQDWQWKPTYGLDEIADDMIRELRRDA